jgi:enoyl-CoA hydratase/carnithine racemase
VSNVEFSVDGKVAKIHLNRAEAFNAITPEMDAALLEAWSRINSDPEIWAVTLSAEGERAFSIGADVSQGTGRTNRIALGGGITGIGGLLVECKKPIVAAVQGYCVGGGFELAMCADLIVASDTAQFGLPETKVGIIGECGVVHRAIRQLPHRIALQMILTGERITAAQAMHYGLINEVVPFKQLAHATQKWVDRLIAASPLAVQAAKAAVTARAGHPLEIALASRFEEIERYAATEDRKEGARASAEHRKPNWSGR